ncbi:conserved hypothetical protein. Putative NADH-ubiquinone oxidoreductase complex 1/LYR family protein [Geotrichum candidum]|uniref:Uncharacterized protein n=1 Tax=Geotrichum candidum TaxID=1173061 RepID=A0A0J9X333_GEOCN|nr:conserved hypothetical protein. Putative NADH-ubiquinone oxidoreductase complex 1/LYR family protein [Geotrichum candidum]
MGKDYPAGYDFFIKKLRSAFRNRSTMTDPVEIEKAIGFGDFIKKELIALYSLKKYRYLKQNYSINENKFDEIERTIQSIESKV